MSKRVDFHKTLSLAILLRLILLVYGEWQDAYMTVKYTDVDYRVFTDAARYCWEGDSPYKRATYRYTPLLALLLTPNIWLHHTSGKLLFVVGDLTAGWLIQQLLTLRGMSSTTAIKYSALWLLNPLVATISTRGNAESLIGALVLLVIYGLAVKRTDTAAVVFGVAVQLKFYPIIYALPLWCFIDDDYTGRTTNPIRRKSSVKEQIYRFFLSWPRIKFGLIAGGVFLGLSAAMYAL
jgi:phosphatidylinositol glycan class M